jgi:hypothetical protein
MFISISDSPIQKCTHEMILSIQAPFSDLYFTTFFSKDEKKTFSRKFYGVQKD